MNRTRKDYPIQPVSDWPHRSVAEIAVKVVSGGTPDRANATYWGGSIPWVTPGELTHLNDKYLSATSERITKLGLTNSGATLLPRDSLLVTTRATLGSVALAAMPLATNQGFKSVIFDSAKDPSFFYHVFSRLTPQLVRRASGTTFLEISGKDFKQLLVPIPTLPEQRRLALVLDTIDEAVLSTERLITKLEHLRRGLLSDLLTRGVTSSRATPDVETGPRWVPDGWKWRTLTEVASRAPYAIVDGPFGSNLKSVHYRTAGIPVIQSGFVTSQRFVASDYVYVDHALFQAQFRSAVRAGDIVMAKIGATCGACAALPDGHPVGILAGNSLKITVDPDCCLRDYLLLVLHRYFETGELHLIRTETAQPAISLARLRRLPIRVPPLNEQEAIVAIAQAAELRQSEAERELAKLRLLKMGLAEDLLSGQVRVPPNIEATA
jgi:type I restriction enzyme S subunit